MAPGDAPLVDDRTFNDASLLACIEETETHGIRFKGPKNERDKRTITIDDDLLTLLLAEREKHLRMIAGVPAGVAVNLGLVRLPDGALMFPNPRALADLSFVTPEVPAS